MDVFDAPAGCQPLIKAYIVALRLHRPVEGIQTPVSRIVHILSFVATERTYIDDMALGENEKVPGIVRIEVEHGDAEDALENDEPHNFGVFAGDAAKDAALGA
jgi:hypothetical protein